MMFCPPYLTKRCVKKQEPEQTGERPNHPAIYNETVGKEKLQNDQNVPWGGVWCI